MENGKNTGRRHRVLGATLLVGGLAVASGAAHASSDASPQARPTTGAVVAAAPVAATGTAPPPAPAVDVDSTGIDAFFAAGYDYDDAVALAELWGSASELDAKATAGRRLLAGEDLPLAPGSAPDVTPAPEVAVPAVDAFFAAGYDYDDAVALAQLWSSPTPYDAKIVAGQRLLAGETLPVGP